MKTLFIYIDPSFNSTLGHYSKLASNIHTYVNRRTDMDIIHLVNKNIEKSDLDTYELTPLFKHSAFINFDTQSINDVTSILDDFQKALFSFIKKESLNLDKYTKVVLYMYTANLEHINILLKLNQELQIPNLNIYTVLFYLDKEFTRGSFQGEYKERLKQTNTNWSSKINNFHLLFDSKRAQNLYQKYFDKPLQLNPVPLFQNTSETIQPKLKNKDKITVTYLGYQSFFHGFHIFYLLYNKLKNNPKYSFIVRANKSIKDENLMKRVENIKKDNNVIFLDKYIDNSQYQQIFEQTDVFVIPYLKNCYPVQTSGVFIEAVYKNKYLIAAKDTWMADNIKMLNNGTCFDSTKIDTIHEAFNQLLDKITDSKINEEKTKQFKSFYTVENLFKQF